MDIILTIPILISFIFSLLFIPKWIKKCKQIDYLWEDMNKPKRIRDVAASGGLIVVMSFLLGVLSYIAIRTFIFNYDKIYGDINLQVFALLTVILISAIVGFTDDILGWKHGGLSVKFRLFLVAMASIPFIVINAGAHEVNLPFFGLVNFGILYPFLLVPIGILGATTTYNFLAGMNGLESGQGIIILSFLSFVAYKTSSPWLALAGLCMVASLLAFYLYNKSHAKIFPGDILTYSVGALIACMAILGNFEKIAVFIFIPYITEVILKLRGRLKKQSFAKPNEDGSLEMPYDKIYGLTQEEINVIEESLK